MHELSAKNVSDLIAEIYRGGRRGNFNGQSLHKIADRFRSTHAALVRNSNCKERDRIYDCVGFDRCQLQEMISAARASGLPFLDSNEFPAGRAFTLRDIAHEQPEPRIDLRNRFLYSHPDRHTLIGMLASDSMHQSLVWFSRPVDQGEFSQRDRDDLELLLPHLRQATALSDELTDLNMQLDTASQVLNRTPFGMFFLDVDGTLLYGNRRAYDMLERDDGLVIRDGKLALRLDERRKDLDAIVRKLRDVEEVDDSSLDRLTVKRSTGDSPYLMVVVPLKLKPSSGRLHGGRVILVQVHDPAAVGKSRVEGLEIFYELTAAEAEVCQRLAEQKSLALVAEDLGVSVNTAKTHLIRSFRKIGVSSQAELLQQLAVHPKKGW
jgi:DNA-binding CsgD family transcriptional regulator